MEVFNVDFNCKRTVYSPTFYGEHKAVQIVSDLPERLNDCDYYIVTFSMDGRLFDSEQITSESTGDITIEGSKIRINLSQDYTNCNKLVFCVSGYKADNSGEVEFIGKTGNSSTILIKDTLHVGNEILSDELSLISRIREGLAKIRELYYERHVHRNKDVLDEITEDTLANVLSNSERRHYHENKDVLDQITQDMVDATPDWNENDTDSSDYIKNRTHWVEYGDTETVSYIWDNANIRWRYNGDNNNGDENYAYNLVDGGTYKISFKGVDYTCIAGITKQISNGTYMGRDNVTMTRIAIGHMKMAAAEDMRYAASEFVFGDTIPICFTYETVTVGNETTVFSEIATVTSTGFNKEANADFVSFSVTPVIYHPLLLDYLPNGVKDASEKKHAHVNKATLDRFYCKLFDPDYNSSGIGFGGGSGGADYENMLSWNGKDIRMVGDGGVIEGANEVTINGRKYLRLRIFYQPMIESEIIEHENDVNTRPRFIDIPIEYSADSEASDGDLTLNGVTVDFGIDSMGQEISEIQEAVNASPDWSENDLTSRCHILNRTHWAEASTETKEFSLTSSYESEGDDYVWEYDGDGEFSCKLIEGGTYTVIYEGNSYEFIAEKTMDSEEEDLHVVCVAIGNTDLLNDEYTFHDNDFPFCISYEEIYENGQRFSETDFVSVSSLDGTTVEFSLTSPSVEYHKLPNDYLQDDIVSSSDWVCENKTNLNAAVNKKSIINKLNEGNNYGTAIRLKYDGNYVSERPVREVSVSNEGDAVLYNRLYTWEITKVGDISHPVTHELAAIVLFDRNNIAISGSDHNWQGEEFFVDFYTGDTAPTVTLPAWIEWVNGEPTYDANKHYQISIMNNQGICISTDYTPPQGTVSE